MIEKNGGNPLDITVKRDGEPLHFTLVPVQMQAKNVFGDDVVYYDLGIKGYTEPKAVVDETVAGMPAAAAGLEAGDQIVAIDDHPIEKWETMQEMVSSSKGKRLIFTIVRGDQTLKVPITPVEVQEKDELLGNQTKRIPDRDSPRGDHHSQRGSADGSSRPVGCF